jgi:hypothetical protein
MKAFDTSVGAEVELECLKGEVRQSRQLVIVDQSGRSHQLLITDDLRDNPKKLREAYMALGVTQPADVRLLCDPSEKAWVEPLIKAAWPTVSFEPRGLAAENYRDGAVVELQVTDRYFRAIAKIGFHYFLSQFPNYKGSEPLFVGIRDFISENKGGIERINDFVGIRQNPLLAPMMDGFRPDGWAAHALCAEAGRECVAHVQLFVCNDYSAPVYTVKLARDTDISVHCSTGHAFKYFEEGPRGKFSGKADSLYVTHFRTARPPKSAVG